MSKKKVWIAGPVLQRLPVVLDELDADEVEVVDEAAGIVGVLVCFETLDQAYRLLGKERAENPLQLELDLWPDS